MDLMNLFNYISHIVLILALGFYVATTMQWYSYKIKKHSFNFSKPQWHILFLLIPIVAYFFSGIFFWIYFYFAYLPSLFVWHKKQDKPLVFTSRIKRYFALLLFLGLFQDVLCFYMQKCDILGVFMPLVVSLIGSELIEKILFLCFLKKATKKLNTMQELTIITITASYGKTSIKNFLFHLLKDDFNCYKTPRSVNTLGGLVKDINEDLPNKTQIYISEAGAREKGDILDIAKLLNPQIAIIGEIGAQHLEYFKSVENIIKTKNELLESKKIKVAFCHEKYDFHDKMDKNFIFYKDDLKNVEASLDGIKFTLLIDDRLEEFEAPILGSFNANNLCVCIKVALYLGLSVEKIKEKLKSLQSVEHRLQRMDANGKIIIDDSFNGNFKGMSESYELVKSYSGRKVLITPGIVESTKQENEALALKMDEVFDLIIITGSLNASTISSQIKHAKLVFLKDKLKMQEVLIEHTKIGDLILFSNDAPQFI